MPRRLCRLRVQAVVRPFVRPMMRLTLKRASGRKSTQRAAKTRRQQDRPYLHRGLDGQGRSRNIAHRTSGFRRRPTGNTIYDCSVRRRLHSDNLWAVAWNPLFCNFHLISILSPGWRFMGASPFKIDFGDTGVVSPSRMREIPRYGGLEYPPAVAMAFPISNPSSHGITFVMGVPSSVVWL